MTSFAEFKTGIVKFLTSSVTPQHAVQYVRELYLEAGAIELDHSTPSEWDIKMDSFYFVKHMETSLYAFKTPKNGSPNSRLIAQFSHSDSPNLRVKPVQASASNGYNTLNVDKYGGILWSRFLDTVMGCAGTLYRVVDGKVVPELFKIEDAAILPSLAIHLERKPEYDGMNCIPIVSTEAALKPAEDATDDEKKEYLNGLVLELLKKEGIDTENVVEIDAHLYSQAPTKVLRFDDIITSPRLDDLCCAYGGIIGLIDTENSERDFHMMAMCDHEEIGNRTLQGAFSRFVPMLFEVLSTSVGANTMQFCGSSLLLSADVSHAIHPGFASKSDSKNCQAFGKGGPVIKRSFNMRNGTTPMTIALVKHAVDVYNETVEDKLDNMHTYMASNASPGGSTMGPFLGGLTGVPTIDYGVYLLSMHSSNETGHVRDMYDLYKFYQAVVRFLPRN
ncbi:hypothetical protein PCE1_004315 [Barthelona sp. PCE]